MEKFIASLTPQAFADWCVESDRYSFFASLHWPEGYVYCRRPGYAAKTGHGIVCRLLSAAVKFKRGAPALTPYRV